MKRLLLPLLITVNTLAFCQGFICAIGGGSEDYGDWSDAPYGWIVQKSDSGKIIILGRSSDVTTWLPGYFISLGADTAYNKTISSITTANLQATYDELITAKAIFIRGGDQWDYIRLWKGTKTEEAIKYIFNNGGVVAGTSAGAAVLGSVDFSAKNGSVYPVESLVNPLNTYMQFENNFLNLVSDVLFDTHFIERGRSSRLMAMLYNRKIAAGENLIGIGIDDRTAVGVYPDRTVEVFGSGAAAFFSIDGKTKLLQGLNGKFTIEGLKCNQLVKGWKYNLNTNEVSFYPSTAKQVDSTTEFKKALSNIYLTGSKYFIEQKEGVQRFISEFGNRGIAVICNSGYSGKIDSLTGYIQNLGKEYSLLTINTSSINDTSSAGTIRRNGCFIFLGDSLNVLSLLKDTLTSAGMELKKKFTPENSFMFLGYAGKINSDFYIDNLYKDMYAGYRGRMTNNKGLSIFPELIFEPAVFDNSDYYENTVSSVLWGMMLNRKKLGIMMHGKSYASVKPSINSIICSGLLRPVFIDASETSLVDSSVYRASGSIGTRQIVAMNNLRYSYSNDYSNYNFIQRKYDVENGVEENRETLPRMFNVSSNYPNPFNPKTTFIVCLPESDFIQISVYNINGEKLVNFFSGYLPAGEYSYEFDGSKYSSGVYLLTVQNKNSIVSKKMVMLK